MSECRTCSAPIAQPGLCSDCAPRVVSAEEMVSDIVEWLRSRYLRELNGGREEEAAAEITRLRAALAEAEQKLGQTQRMANGFLEQKLRAEAALAEAEREKDEALDRLCTAPGEGDLVTAATDMTANYVEANRRAERAEALANSIDKQREDFHWRAERAEADLAAATSLSALKDNQP